MDEYDVIVIGGGIAGTQAAIEAADHGLKTMVIEEKKIGGTCLNCGCIPSKYLLYMAEGFERVGRIISKGIIGGEAELNYTNIALDCLNIVEILYKGMKNSLLQKKIDIVYGKAFVDEKKITVGEKEFTGRNVIIATGTTPTIPDISGLAKALSNRKAYTNEEIFSVDRLTNSLVVIGGGASGVEMAYVYALMGTKVTVLEANNQILNMFDTDLTRRVKQILKGKGIDIYTDVIIDSVDDSIVSCQIDGEYINIEYDRIYVSAGRKANDCWITESIRRNDKNYIDIDANMRTNISGVFAIGDITGKGMLAYTGTEHAKAVIDTIMGCASEKCNKIVPKILFISPECMQVGASEDELKAEGKSYNKAELSMNYSGRFVINQDGLSPVAYVKMLLDEKNVIVGASMISTHASEMAAMFSMMIEHGFTISEIASIMFPHPTESEVVRDCALKYIKEQRGKGIYE